MLYVYGSLMPVRALEEVRFWKMQEREHTVVIRTLVPDLENPFVKLLAEWESVFEQAEIAAQRQLEAALRGGLVLTPPQQAEVSQLLTASAEQSQHFIRHLMRMEQESEPIRKRPIVKTVIEHIIRESGYFLGVLQAGDPLHAVQHPPVPGMPGATALDGYAIEGMGIPFDGAWNVPAVQTEELSLDEAGAAEAAQPAAAVGAISAEAERSEAAGGAAGGDERTYADEGAMVGDEQSTGAGAAEQRDERMAADEGAVSGDAVRTAAGGDAAGNMRITATSGDVGSDRQLTVTGCAGQSDRQSTLAGGAVQGDWQLTLAGGTEQGGEWMTAAGDAGQGEGQLSIAGGEGHGDGHLKVTGSTEEAGLDQSADNGNVEAESYKEYSLEAIPAARQETDVQVAPFAPFTEINEEDGRQKVYLHSHYPATADRLEPQLLSATGEGTWTGVMEGEMVPIGGHRLPPLPYAYNALEPHIDEATMRLHHDKHHQSYVDGLNRAEKKLADARESGDYSLVKHWERELAFHGAGHYLHTLFWSTMSPKGGGRPAGALAEHIKRYFGSFERFHHHFSEAANQVEGGGWAMLVWSPRSRRVEIVQAEKHQNLSQQDIVPLLPLDVWEHSYYLKYRNERAKYVAAWWNVVSWPAVEQRFAKALKLSWPVA